MRWKSIAIILLTSLLLIGQISLPTAANAASSTADLNISVNPAKPEGYLIDAGSGVATADINMTITPHGSITSETRLQNMDVIFIMDVSDSMDRGLLGELLGWLLGIDSKMTVAKKAAKNTIENFKNKAIAGDRFALITYSNVVTEKKSFNAKGQSKSEVKAHLSNISSTIDSLKAGSSYKVDYYNALKKAEEMFGDSKNSKYIIFLANNKPNVGNTTVIRNIDGMYERQVGLTKFYVKQDNTVIKNNILGQMSEFDYNGTPVIKDRFGFPVTTFKYSRKYNTYALAAFDAASSLATKKVKIFSVWVGKWDKEDKEFLAEFSALTGASSFTAKTYDELNNNLQHISNVISQSAMKDIQLRINLNNVSFPEDGHVGIPEDTKAFKSDSGDYIIVDIPDIDYIAGAGTPSAVYSSFKMEFDKPGDYTFNDVALTYTDLAGKKNTKSTSFTVKVVDQFSVGLEFNQELYTINAYNNVTTKQLGIASGELKLIPIPGEDPEDAEWPEELTWSTGDPNIAIVNSDGTVTAKGLGTTTVTVADASNPTIKATAQVKVNLKAIRFNNSNYQYNGTDLLLYDQLYDPAYGFSIIPEAFEWSSNNDTILAIDKDTGYVFHNIDTKGGFVVVNVKLKDEYKIDPSEKVEAKTLIKVRTTNKEDHTPEKEW